MDFNLLYKIYQPGKVLDPSYVQFIQEYVYLDNLNIRLVELDKNGNYSLSLANSINFTNDKKTLEITLKEYFFSDGKKITTKDVVNSFKRVILKGSPHSKPINLFIGAENLKNIDDKIKGFEIINDQSFKINLKNPNDDILYYLNLVDYSILHPSKINSNELRFEDWSKNVSGPYTLSWSKIKNKPIFSLNDQFQSSDNTSPPKRITVKDGEIDDIESLIQKKEIDFGYLNFNQFLKVIPTLKSFNEYKIFGDNIDSITYIILNTKSDKFKNKLTRQAFYKKIFDNFKLNQDEKYSLKAYQYFLPGSEGYVKKDYVINKLNELENIDFNFKNLTLKTFTTMRKYLPENLSNSLSSSLGINVSLDFDLDPKDTKIFFNERKFDAFVMTGSMSLKVISETINYIYNKNNKFLTDPTGKISELIDAYQVSKSDNRSTLNKILKQMILDSECIPLYYHIRPHFYNENLFKLSDFGYQESIQLWKINTK